MVLEAENGPLHYRMLTTALQAADPEMFADYKRPADSLYSLMTADIRKVKTGAVTKSRFKFLGDGIFCAPAVVVGAESVVVHPNAKAEPKPKPVEEPQGGRECGNCSALTYSGVQTVLRTMGSCGNPQSGESYVRQHFVCPHWRRRTHAQEEADHKIAIEARETIAAVNATVRRAPMAGRDTR